ncbi:hypothetical protein BO78DRAFT_434330 [Aspergillus sclerotiicarbonarius CBS 121057]|uniref:Uncharacterized protein n=1 Tax=Aspergillus sclerotiicarbonarius (strain CBS 121057 / IBT 28362) TaxID=1448318 RepID=A0A319E248_ASPSB|nr:hypothetical protein BO78DRAFT_434330 [Aspergillus sclerotiicarbonarius CBS 121057]
MANELPGHKSAWENNVKVEKLENKTIHNVDLTSASTISDEQYLILRALWKRYKFDQLDLAKFGLEDWNTKAIEMLKTYQSWTHHCNSFSSNAENEGTFSLPQFYQKQVALIPDDIPFRPNVTLKRQQIVNTALVDFLNAFIIHYKLRVYWTLYRKPFIAKFENGAFEARTDGCLEDRASKTYAIVEVKPMLREKEVVRISMQETAEMVAWIKCDPDPKEFSSSCGRTDMKSLIFAEYGVDYVKYLNNTLRPDEKPGFLTMHQFGAWDTRRAGDMKQLGSILLPLALRGRANHVNDLGVQAQASPSVVS